MYKMLKTISLIILVISDLLVCSFNRGTITIYSVVVGQLTKLLTFPPGTKVLSGHENATTVKHEAKSNPFLNNQSKIRLYP